MTKFEEFLIGKGCERYYYKTEKLRNDSVVEQKVISYIKEDISALSVFGYNYSFNGKLISYYGLLEHPLPPSLFLMGNKLLETKIEGANIITRPASQTKYNIFFKQKIETDFEEIFDVAISDNKCYVIDENNKIELVKWKN